MQKAWMLVLALVAVHSPATLSQVCSIHSSPTGMVLFTWQDSTCVSGYNCDNGEVRMPATRWNETITADLQHEGTIITAHLNSDAGTLTCVGNVQNGTLRGSSTFEPRMSFIERLKGMGFTVPTSALLQEFTVLDVTTDWVADLQHAGVTGMSSDLMLEMKALGIDHAYVQGMEKAGFSHLAARTLIRMKATGVTPSDTAQLRALGYSPSEDELIQLGALRINATFIRKVHANEKGLTIAQIIRLKALRRDS